MANTLKIALVLSAAAHVALLLMRWQSEPLVEGNLLSLDVRLNVENDGAAEPISASIPEEPETATETEALVEPPPGRHPTRSPGNLDCRGDHTTGLRRGDNGAGRNHPD